MEEFAFIGEIKTIACRPYRSSRKRSGSLPQRIGIMVEDEYKAAVAAFIRAKGVTRCPTACAVPTQGTVAANDRAALEDYAIARTLSRRQRQAARQRSLWAAHAPD
jgi:hypothetical protein